MSLLPLQLACAGAVTGAVSLAVLGADHAPLLSGPWARYRAWWIRGTRTLRLDPRFERAPAMQLSLALFLAGVGTWMWIPLAYPVAAAVLAAPPWLLWRRGRAREAALGDQLDGMLQALANALSTTPNLGDALASVVDHLEPPIRDEVREVLSETDLGRPIDEALIAMARRTDVPGFEPAVAAAVMGRRTGGDLPAILEGTARTLREISRLEGVVRTKTAEGRNQALVMGLVPPFLVLALHKIDPDWLAPMWHDPIGWILLGAAAVLEIAAVALIRKIMAVDI
jgi:tight adherence protein B